jgi:hypothetical protein
VIKSNIRKRVTFSQTQYWIFRNERIIFPLSSTVFSLILPLSLPKHCVDHLGNSTFPSSVLILHLNHLNTEVCLNSTFSVLPTSNSITPNSTGQFNQRHEHQPFITYVPSAFAKLRKTAICLAISVCLYVCPSVRKHRTTPFPIDGFVRNLVFEYFLESLTRKFKFN